MTAPVVIPPEVALPLIRDRVERLAVVLGIPNGLNHQFLADALYGIAEDLEAVAAQLPAVA